MPSLNQNDVNRLLEDDDPVPTSSKHSRARQPRRKKEDVSFRPRTRAHERGPFKCGRCRAFVGPIMFGGRHRNHCPLCLTSRHVDLKRPGDRQSPCRALMPAVAVAFRPDGEQMVVHRCNGCGIERRNRVAADDNPIALLRLPPVIPSEREWSSEEAAIA